MLEVGRLALSKLRHFYDPKGNLKPLHTLPLHLTACLASSRTIIAKANRAQLGTTSPISMQPFQRRESSKAS
jgi:hypothetical protein